jgi:hypothetical protein
MQPAFINAVKGAQVPEYAGLREAHIFLPAFNAYPGISNLLSDLF